MTDAATIKPHVLVVDDDDGFRTLVVRFLDGAYDVEAATNGEEGLAHIQARMPDIILTDILMPKMDGLEFIKHVRSDERTQSIPIVILLATALADDIRAVQTFPATGILPKETITREGLLSKVEELLAHAKK